MIYPHHRKALCEIALKHDQELMEYLRQSEEPMLDPLLGFTVQINPLLPRDTAILRSGTEVIKVIRLKEDLP